MKRLLAHLLLLAAAATAQAQIAVGSATPRTTGTGSTVFPEQQVFPAGSPGLIQTRNGDSTTARCELGPVMGFVSSSGSGAYASPIDGVTTTWTEKDAWTYEGEMYMTAGTSYTLGTYIDDYATIAIDGTQILNQGQCRFTTATYVCNATGWHGLSVKIWDTGGGYGNQSWAKGVAYNTFGATAQSSGAWQQLIDPGDGSLLRTTKNVVVSYSGVRVAAQMRESDPTVMDVDYIVFTDPTTTPTVNVRCLAFEDGERGFATVIRPETFIEGTDANLGDGIAANVPHRLSWKVSSDWATDLAKVKFEVMAMKPGDLLLPGMHFVTVPAAEGRPKTVVSVNDLSSSAYEITRDANYYNGIYMRWPWFTYSSLVGSRAIGNDVLLSALLWLYASADSRIHLDNGSLWTDEGELVRHAAFANNDSGWGLNEYPHWPGNWSISLNAIRYVFGKMGYRLLEDEEELAWVNDNTRLGLTPQQFRQYAVKTVEE